LAPEERAARWSNSSEEKGGEERRDAIKYEKAVEYDKAGRIIHRTRADGATVSGR